MKAWVCLTAAAGIALAVPAGAYEYHLQFTANSGHRGLVVAGYRFSGSTVIGNCSYYTVHSGSGRGGGYHTTTTHYDQTCTWDLHGNLLGVAPGAPAVPKPLYTKGTLTVYARNAKGDTTGVDTAKGFGGFVDTPGSHYTWETSNAYEVLQQIPYRFRLTLLSDGDIGLQIAGVEASALHARAAVGGTTCTGNIPVGGACTVTVSYDPTRLASPTGLAYDTLTVGVTSNFGQAYDFVQSYTIVLKAKSDDD